MQDGVVELDKHDQLNMHLLGGGRCWPRPRASWSSEQGPERPSAFP